MVFYISEGSPHTVLSDARIGELLQQVPPRLRYVKCPFASRVPPPPPVMRGQALAQLDAISPRNKVLIVPPDATRGASRAGSRCPPAAGCRR